MWNGTQIETVSIPVGQVDELIVPKNWTVEENSESVSEIQLIVTKKLSYAGIPPEPIALDDVVDEMGIAKKLQGSELKLRDFGGFISSSGGTLISVSIVVPKSIKTRTTEFENLSKSEIRIETGWSQIKGTVVSKKYGNQD